ncbi:unnamed protein product, partial [Staurois parvus]
VAVCCRGPCPVVGCRLLPLPSGRLPPVARVQSGGEIATCRCPNSLQSALSIVSVNLL